MIPLILRIQNFLSYGPTLQTIDFRPYKLICLSGRNGHGKSALLDAITWALWGSARKMSGTSKADQGVLKLGQTELMVSLDFIVNGQTYRVRRVFSTKYGKPSAHVDFGTYNQATDTFSALTEKTMRRTQETINTVLGVDYDAFINSSFLRQGQANEFSKKSPKDRKDVLASILGLNRYEKAKKIASEKARELITESEYNKKLSQKIISECENIPVIESKLERINGLLQELSLKQQSYQRIMTHIEQEKERINAQAYDITQKEQENTRVTHELTGLHDRFYQLVSQWKKTHAALLHLPDKHILEIAKLQLQEALTKEQKRIEQQLALQITCLEYKEKEQTRSSELEKNAQHVIAAQQLLLERMTLESTFAVQEQHRLTKELQLLTEEQNKVAHQIREIQTTTPAHLLITDTQELQTTFERHKQFYQRWLEAGNIITNELKHVYEKKNMIDDTNNPSCPLCEQNVSLARKRFLAKKFTDQDRFLLHRVAKLKRLIAWIKTVLTEQHAALEASKKIDVLLKEHSKTTTALHQKQEETTTQEHKIEAQKKEILTQTSALKQLIEHGKSTLEQDSMYIQLHSKRKELERELAALSQQHSNQGMLARELKRIEAQEQEWFGITESTRLQQERKELIHELCLTIKQKKRTLHAPDGLTTARKNLQDAVTTLKQQEATTKKDMLTWQQEQQTILQEKGACEHSLKLLTEQKQALVTYEEQIATQLKEAQLYGEIVQAYGKDGIQALLIEDALPEIEQEANDLLSKLTDNQTHIFIESLRDLKKGGTKETLDINISDSSGIRPYEMFSGGEAFRIDFALRIAISKLLARRAGTSLQTLIIDEGFGSQDEEGLSRIMDVIYKIQNDFEKVIIVSHLATMKDQFPVHFIIEKEMQGSVVTIRELA